LEATLTSALGRTTLSANILSIGQASDNQLVIDDAQVSAHHAEIKPSPDGATYLVTDRNSSHGTFVNGERLPIHTPRALHTGDIILIGNLHFTYEMTGNVLQAQSPQAHAQPDYSISPSSPPPFATQLAKPPQPKGLWITLALVVVLVVGTGILGILYYANRSTPTRTLQSFCTDFKNSNVQGVYDLLSSHAQAQTSVGVLNALVDLVQSSGGVHDCTVSHVQENGSTATGHLTITLTNAQSNQSLLEHLTNEQGTWKMEEIAIESPSY
jgi:hypothetical protein